MVLMVILSSICVIIMLLTLFGVGWIESYLPPVLPREIEASVGLILLAELIITCENMLFSD